MLSGANSWHKSSWINQHANQNVGTLEDYLERTLAVVVLHLLVSSPSEKHSGTGILRKTQRNCFKEVHNMFRITMGQRSDTLLYQKCLRGGKQKTLRLLNDWRCKQGLRDEKKKSTSTYVRTGGLLAAKMCFCCSTQRGRRSEGERDR